MDFGGFDSSTILNLRGGIPWPIGDLPESLSQAMLVGTMLAGRLGVLFLLVLVCLNGANPPATRAESDDERKTQDQSFAPSRPEACYMRVHMYVCMYVCMYVYIYIHTYIRICIYAFHSLCIYIYIYIYIYMYEHVCLYIHTYIYIYICLNIITSHNINMGIRL